MKPKEVKLCCDKWSWNIHKCSNCPNYIVCSIYKWPAHWYIIIATLKLLPPGQGILFILNTWYATVAKWCLNVSRISKHWVFHEVWFLEINLRKIFSLPVCASFDRSIRKVIFCFYMIKTLARPQSDPPMHDSGWTELWLTVTMLGYQLWWQTR